MDFAPESSAPIVQVNDLRIAFGAKTIVEHVSFDVRPGEILFLGGNSGCGKSSIFKHIVGLHSPAAGEILINSKNMATMTPAEQRDTLSKIGVSFQGGALFGSMTLLENICLPLREFTSLSAEQRRCVGMSKLALVGLVDAAARYPSEVSGGMLKRAAVARALALDPQLVILDEPGAGLDPLSSSDLDRLISSLRDLLHATFIIVSHELRSIFAIADRLLLVDAARKTDVAIGPPTTLRDNCPDRWVRTFLQAGETT